MIATLSLKRLYDWFGKQVHTPYATPLLVFLFFIEAIFFIPVDPLLILYCIEDRTKSLYYATLATAASVAGGIAAYYIGFAIWESIGSWLVHLLFTPQQFEHALENYTKYESWAVLIAGFTPLPYKVVTLTAGFCKLPFVPFVLYSLISRGARFFLVAGIIMVWGRQIKECIDRYFNLLVLLFTALVIVTLLWLR